MRRKILILTPWYPDATMRDGPRSVLGVSGSFVRDQVLALHARHDVAVIHLQDAVSAERRLWAVVEDGGEPVPTLRVRRGDVPLRQARTVAHMAGAGAAVRHLGRRGWRPELLHAHVFAAGVTAVLLGRLLRVPTVVSEHFGAFRDGQVRGWDRRVARFAFEHAGLVAPVSDDLRRHLEAIAPDARLRVVPNLVDTSLFHPRDESRRNGGFRLLVVALLNENKGVGDLLESLAAARGLLGAVTLDVIGDGPVRASLERRSGDLGLSDAVTFHGTRSRAEVAAAMRDADAFVLPSRGENLPCVVIEALASGLPVVATRVGGVPELVDESNGLLVPPASPDALADALVEMARRRPGYDSPAMARRATARFSAETVSKTWDEIYEGLLA